jgi:hypothetical protein
MQMSICKPWGLLEEFVEDVVAAAGSAAAVASVHPARKEGCRNARY